MKQLRVLAPWIAFGWVVFRMAAADGGKPGGPAVSALGRIEPAGGVVHVAAPYTQQGPPILAELLVRDGQGVTNAQLLARTHIHSSARAAWQESLRELDAARARLIQAEAGAKPADLAVLDSEARRAQAEFSDAARELERFKRLRAQGVISIQELDAVETRALSSSNVLSAALQRKVAGIEVRPVDVAVARTGVAVAEARAERMRAEWEQTEIRAPRAGVILKVHSRVGEQVGPAGLLDLGRLDEMDVQAEVYETDVRQVMPGQRAEVTGESFSGTLAGRVQAVGLQVRPNRLLQPDPAAFTDSRVVEVLVRLDDGRAASRLSGALVNVRIFK